MRRLIITIVVSILAAILSMVTTQPKVIVDPVHYDLAFTKIEMPQFKDFKVREELQATVVPGSHEDWMTQAGIKQSDWFYVDYIVTRESGWRYDVVNEIGACGLVQALPCSKVPGNGLNPVDNLKWANDYAQTCEEYRHYCGWEGAYNFWVANHNW